MKCLELFLKKILENIKHFHLLIAVSGKLMLSMLGKNFSS